MKKNLVLALAAFAVLIVSSCKKEGVFHPDMKLSGISEYSNVSYQVYIDSTRSWKTIHEDVVKRHTVEEWSWDGSNLNRINFLKDGKVDYSLFFTYDGSKLSRVTNSKSKNYTDFVYDGRKIDEMRFCDKNGSLLSTFKFDHNGNHIRTITVSPQGGKGTMCDEPLVAFALRMTVPEVCQDALVRQQACKSGSDVTLRLSWTNDNIKSIEYLSSDNIESAVYTYDKYNNPYKGFLATMSIGATPHEMFMFGNKNNMTSSTVKYKDGSKEKKSFSYTYSENYPVSQSQCIIDNFAQGSRYLTTYIVYYEYYE